MLPLDRSANAASGSVHDVQNSREVVCYTRAPHEQMRHTMTTHATSDATRRYAARFAATSAVGAYREPVGCATPERGAPLLSSIGIGTYLGHPDAATDQAYTATVIAAVEGGIN